MTEPQFGVYLFAHRLGSPQALLDVASAAEELGFDSLWVGERVLYPAPAPPDAPIDFEPLTVLSYVAARTGRIRLGTSTLILPYRHPILVAKAVATLDQLSGGRAVLGVGAGWLEGEFAALGGPLPPPRRHLRRAHRRPQGALDRRRAPFRGAVLQLWPRDLRAPARPAAASPHLGRRRQRPRSPPRRGAW